VKLNESFTALHTSNQHYKYFSLWVARNKYSLEVCTATNGTYIHLQ